MLSLRNIRLLHASSRFLAKMLPSSSSNLANLPFNGSFGPTVVPFGSRLRNVQPDTLFFYFYHRKGINRQKALTIPKL